MKLLICDWLQQYRHDTASQQQVETQTPLLRFVAVCGICCTDCCAAYPQQIEEVEFEL